MAQVPVPLADYLDFLDQLILQSWFITAWRWQPPVWLEQPVLTIGGLDVSPGAPIPAVTVSRDFVFDWPDDYIVALTALKDRGATGPIQRVIDEFLAIPEAARRPSEPDPGGLAVGMAVDWLSDTGAVLASGIIIAGPFPSFVFLNEAMWDVEFPDGAVFRLEGRTLRQRVEPAPVPIVPPSPADTVTRAELDEEVARLFEALSNVAAALGAVDTRLAERITDELAEAHRAIGNVARVSAEADSLFAQRLTDELPDIWDAISNLDRAIRNMDVRLSAGIAAQEARLEAFIDDVVTPIVQQQSDITNRLDTIDTIADESGSGGVLGFMRRVVGFAGRPFDALLDMVGEWVLREVRSGLPRR